MVWERTHPRCSCSLLAWTGGKVVLGRAGPGCSRSALAGTGGKVGRGPHTPPMAVRPYPYGREGGKRTRTPRL